MKRPITQTILLIAMTLAAIGTSLAQPCDRRADLNVLPGDLLFFRDTEGMGAAVKGEYGAIHACGDGDRHLFEAKPMNWRNADGKLPKYWKNHFKRLKMPVPEGVMGTNPTELSRSPLLRKL